MMRALFWILLGVNVIFFAAMQWGGMLTASDQPIQAQTPVNEDKIRLTTPAQIQYMRPVSPAGAPGCFEWGEFSGEALDRANAALEGLQLGDRLSQRQIEQSIGYWVYIPPLKDKAAVAQKIAQLKARGVKEYFVVTEDGQWHDAISLGIFKTREAADHFLEELRGKDVRSAVVGERAGKLKAAIFLLSGLDPDAAARLTAMQQEFTGSELKEVPCALTR